MNATPIVKLPTYLGEGPVWHSIQQMLYWVDIENGEVHLLEPHTGRHRMWNVHRRVGAVAPMANGNILLALQGQIAEMNPDTGAVRKILDLESDVPDNRCNDGKTDPAGRFWIGTMERACKPGMGSLYCIDRDYKVTKMLSGLTISNGMGWSPEEDVMYFIDSADHNVRRYRFNREAQSMGKEKVILTFDNPGESPDGMCVDSEGKLWIAFWGGFRVGRFDPETGKHLQDIRVPVPQPSSCCFGGKDLQTLYITSAREGMTQDQIDKYPLSGSLFSARPGVEGLESYYFGRN
jgi:sugar lactone lactonase YvrE